MDSGALRYGVEHGRKLCQFPEPFHVLGSRLDTELRADIRVSLGHIRCHAAGRRFKVATGLAVIDYLQNLRIEAGKELLETTRTPVDEISADVGYTDSSFFRRLFRRLVGLTPMAYRRMFSGDRPLSQHQS
jgi:methylphosphotriester-DNA--protein-cysteine methyltransferase